MSKWKIVKLGDLLTESKIESKIPNTKRRIRVKLNIGGIEQRPDTKDKKGATKYYIRRHGQFIYGKQNLHKGAFGIVPEELDGFESSADIPAFDIHESCYPEWIFYFFKQNRFYLKLESIAKGVGSKRISSSQIFALNISLPPKDIQRKILDSIIEFEEKFNILEKEFDSQTLLISKLKATSFREAVHGKLTESWRKLNQTETAENLLDLITARKGEFFIKKNTQKKEYSNISSTELYSIPVTWKWCKLGDIIINSNSGKSPQCENRPANIDEWGVLKTTAVQNLFFLENENKALPKKNIVNSDLEVKAGDVLVTRAGPRNRVGVVTAVVKTRKFLLLSDKTVRLNSIKEYINSEYLAIFLSSGVSKDFLNSKKSGMAESQVNISQANMLLTPIPLVPFEEQIEIVNRVNKVLSDCIELEKNIQVQRENLKRLSTNILGDSFLTAKNDLLSSSTEQRELKKINKIALSFDYEEIGLEKKDENMELLDLLKINGKMLAVNLWKMSKHENDIDAFYEDLKKQIEVEKTIIESDEKGYLELIK